MCFRPASAASSVKCPKCGFENPSVATTCLECDADLAEAKAAGAPAPTAPAAPDAPASLSAPGAPGAPMPPSAN